MFVLGDVDGIENADKVNVLWQFITPKVFLYKPNVYNLIDAKYIVEITRNYFYKVRVMQTTSCFLLSFFSISFLFCIFALCRILIIKQFNSI